MSGKDDFGSQLMGGLRNLFGKGQPAPQAGSATPQGTPMRPGAERPPAPAPPAAYGAYSSPTVKKQIPKTTAPLGSAGATLALPRKLTPEERAEESKRRMAIIVTYLKNPEALGELKDSRFLYKVITDERDHLMDVINEWQAQIRDLTASWTGDPEDEVFLAARDELAWQVENLKQKQAQLFMMLKKLTGVKGKTGGTGFLVMPSKPKEEGKAGTPQ